MAIRLRRPDQPLSRQVLLGVFEFLASLRLAVILLGLGSLVLAWTTFTEGRWGTAAAQFAVYQSWWFALLLGLLAVNVFASAAIRFPWKRYQTGFVLIHSGIVILLIGAFITRMYGIDAQLGVVEGRENHLAFEQSKVIRLAIASHEKTGASRGDTESDAGETETIVDIPFRCGPFNWDDYLEMAFFPWRLIPLDRGVLYDRDGIKVEAADYYSDSTEQPIPRLVLDVREQSAETWELSGEGRTEVVLDVRWPRDSGMEHRLFGIGSRQQLPTGQRIVFWMTGSPAEADAFLRSAPSGELGKKGQIVLSSGGKTTIVPLDGLAEGAKIPIEGADLFAEFVGWDPKMLAVELAVHSQKPRVERMLLFADFPELNRQDYVNGVFGTYWFDPKSDLPEVDRRMSARVAMPRLDILQTPKQTLSYRAWKDGAIEEARELAENGGDDVTIIAFKDAKRSLAATIVDFVPSELPRRRIQPLPFTPGERARQPRVRLSVNVDGQTREKWVSAVPVNPLVQGETEDEKLIVRGDGRTVTATLRGAEVELGFAVKLHAFNYRRDPGTSMPSHYSSLVDFVNPDDPAEIYEKDVLINMNEPADFRDPKTGRVYRVFQQSYAGPWTPGQPGFEQLAAEDPARNRFFLSWFTVNYDPGRGVIYAGSLLIVLGISIAFYMKAYFFKPAARPVLPGKSGAQNEPCRGESSNRPEAPRETE